MRVLVGTNLGGKVFGLGDRPFIVAVRLTHQMVMTAAGKVVFTLVTVIGVNQFAVPLHQAKSGCGCADADKLRGRSRVQRVARHFNSVHCFR